MRVKVKIHVDGDGSSVVARIIEQALEAHAGSDFNIFTQDIYCPNTDVVLEGDAYVEVKVQSLAQASTVKPDFPEKGDYWADMKSQTIFVWDGDRWLEMNGVFPSDAPVEWNAPAGMNRGYKL